MCDRGRGRERVMEVRRLGFLSLIRSNKPLGIYIYPPTCCGSEHAFTWPDITVNKYRWMIQNLSSGTPCLSA
ncbi:hypothetical protein ACS0TY_003861 [Phlomoides rotata]